MNKTLITENSKKVIFHLSSCLTKFVFSAFSTQGTFSVPIGRYQDGLNRAPCQVVYTSCSRMTLYNINGEFFSRFPCLHGPCTNQSSWPNCVPCLREGMRQQGENFLWSFKIYTLLGMEQTTGINTLEGNT